MAAPARFDVVRARPLLHFDALVAELGGDARALRATAGTEADGPLTYRQLVDLLERAAEALACPDLGMRLAARQGADALYGPLGEAMRHAPTLGHALRTAAVHSHAHSPAAGIWQRPHPADGTVLLGHDILVEGLTRKAQAVELLLLGGSAIIAAITGGAVRPRRVLFRHRAVAPAAAYRRHFGCEARFGEPADALVYDDRALACPLPASDPARHAAAVTLIEATFAGDAAPLGARVRGAVSHLLLAGDCAKERIAAELGLHPRSLQRRLAEEGTSFRRIKDEVRRDLMLYYLAHTDEDLTRVAERLGFAEQAVLTRFCRKWFDRPPSRLRAAG